MKFLPVLTAAALFMVGAMAIPTNPGDDACIPLSPEHCRLREDFKHASGIPDGLTFCGYCEDLVGEIPRLNPHGAFLIDEVGLCCSLGDPDYCKGPVRPENCPILPPLPPPKESS
ncbi:hypothetical protein D8B26_007004 [Coccidioides posadasii str. Silveira]|uniref:Uncharacterized protein n=1 Tax=Coccidioides posadasii (strain RMSCC 757 / Silveira) TaxID=443226 RepID=E9DGE2_COCPS|nr:hypothetical protein CPSG_08891 [Coccidioides posadasii str. Silveira]QVM12374.1 hypothetical protein D8B26_007004 [Coccidioides posadasii str. Silveira]